MKINETATNVNRIKLHLGCGERYLKGYTNIDYPSSEHTVQVKSVADQHANLLELKFSAQSVKEVRLHHVFEHFPRPEAVALLAGWNTWLEDNGSLHIEVPDLNRSAWSILNPFSTRYLVSTRHLFGSHEAHWAIHCEGWSRRSLKYVLKGMGYGSFKFVRSNWKGTHNIEVIAKKTKTLSVDEARVASSKIMKRYLLDDSSTEKKLLAVWESKFETQLIKMLPKMD